MIARGYIYGLLLISTLMNMAVGLPAILGLSAIAFNKKLIRKSNLIILFLLLFKILWMSYIQVNYSLRFFSTFLTTMAADGMLCMFLFYSVEKNFLKGFFRPFLILFYVDFIFNVCIYLIGFDPFGRAGSYRPDDILPRLGGIFGHPFYSVNIAFIAIISALFCRKKVALFLAVLGLLMNGTLRAPLAVSIIAFVYVLLYLRFNPLLCLFFGVFSAGMVFFITIYTGIHADYASGNMLRAIAWDNAIFHIMRNPIFGTHIFPEATTDITGSVITVLRHGIAESYYLQLSLDYGMPPAIASLCVFSLISIREIKNFYEYKNHYTFISALLALTIFIDNFYGSLFGIAITTIPFCMLCVSSRSNSYYEK